MTTAHIHKALRQNLRIISGPSRRLLRVYRRRIGPMHRAITWYLNFMARAIRYGVEQQLILGREPDLKAISKFHYLPKDKLEMALFEQTVDDYVPELERNFAKARKPFTNITTNLVDWHCLRMKGEQRVGRMYVQVYGEAMGVAGQIARVNLDFNLRNQRAIDWAAKESSKLIRDINLAQREVIRSLLADGIEQGRGVWQIGKDIRDVPQLGLTKIPAAAQEELKQRLGATDMPHWKQKRVLGKEYRKRLRYRAEMIARTEVADSVSEATLDAYGEAEVARVRFEASADACEVCSGYDGQIWSREEASGIISVHPNCRCTWVPVIKKTPKNS